MLSANRRNLAIVLSSVGFHWEELAAAYKVFVAAGMQIKFFTPTGKPAVADPNSLIPKKYLSNVGIGSPLEIAPDTEFGQELWKQIKTATSIVEMNPSEFTGLYLPGGHGCLFDVNISQPLHQRILDFYQSGKALGAVCHATSTFAFVQKQGVYIVEGKSLTGFPDLMDDLLLYADGIDKSLLPIPFSNDGKLLSSHARNPITQRIMALINPFYFVVDPPFITGVGPKAAASVALKMLDHLH